MRRGVLNQTFASMLPIKIDWLIDWLKQPHWENAPFKRAGDLTFKTEFLEFLDTIPNREQELPSGFKPMKKRSFLSNLHADFTRVSWKMNLTNLLHTWQACFRDELKKIYRLELGLTKSLWHLKVFMSPKFAENRRLRLLKCHKNCKA